MKKLISLLLIIAVAFSMVACDLQMFINDVIDVFSIGFESVYNDGGTFSGDNTGMRGIIEEDTYINDYIGIQFTKPNLCWGYMSDKKLAETFSTTADIIHNDNFKQSLDERLVLYDMMVQNALTGTSVLVGYENLDITLSTDMSEAQYLESFKKYATSANIGYEFPNEMDTSILGKIEFTRLVYTQSVDGVSMTHATYVRKIDSYMAIIIITIPNYSLVELEELEARFQ